MTPEQIKDAQRVINDAIPTLTETELAVYQLAAFGLKVLYTLATRP